MNVNQTPNRCRDVDFQIWDIQVDMQSPKRDVILKSTSQPALRTHTRRDDIRMLDVHLREVQLVLGHLEVSVTGALMDQARLLRTAAATTLRPRCDHTMLHPSRIAVHGLRRNLTLGMGGLTFEQVLSRAKGGIHLSNPQPPAASSKLVVSNLVAREAKVDVWCQLHLPDAYYLPKSLRDTIQAVSLGATRLDVKGAHVKLPSQALFTNQPAEGNVSIVTSKVWLNYLPLQNGSTETCTPARSERAATCAKTKESSGFGASLRSEGDARLGRHHLGFHHCRSTCEETWRVKGPDSDVQLCHAHTLICEQRSQKPRWSHQAHNTRLRHNISNHDCLWEAMARGPPRLARGHREDFNEAYYSVGFDEDGGGAAGSSEPTEVLRVQRPTSYGDLRNHIEFRILSAALGSAPGAAMFFSTYETMKQVFKSFSGDQEHPIHHASASACGEVMACLVRVPTANITQNMQVGRFTRLTEAVRAINKTGGLGAFYVGYGTMVMREIPFSFIQFPLYERFKKIIADRQGSETTALQGAACGSVAGGIAGGSTTPLDVAKTRIMLEKVEEGAVRKYGGTLQALSTIFAEEGVQGLFKGIGPRVTWITVGGFIFFGAYEGAQKGLQRTGLWPPGMRSPRCPASWKTWPIRMCRTTWALHPCTMPRARFDAVAPFSAYTGAFAGADIDCQTFGGKSALHFAAEHQLPELVEVLCLFGADANLLDAKANTAMHLALAKVGGRDTVKKQILEQLVSASACFQVHNLSGLAPLHLACSTGAIRCVQFLIESGSDILATTAAGESGLHLACASGFAEVVQLFIHHAFRLIDVDLKNNQSLTAYEVSTAKGQDLASRHNPELMQVLREAQKEKGEEAGNSGAPNPEEVPLWNSSETSRSPNPFDDGDEQAFESPEPKEICWTPSFTSLKEKSFEENVLEKSFEAKPSRVSLAPTVHEAVSEMDLEGDEGYLGNDVEPEQVQEDGQMTKAMPDVSHASCNDQVSALLREISELRAAAVEEVKTRTELEALQHQTAEQLSSCQTQVAQMAQELKKSKAERDYLKSRLEETSENLVELTKRLRKEQEVNKSLDKELNKAEAARLDLQNQLERFQFQVHEDQPQAMAESLDSSIASAPDLEKEALEEELELPTAGGLLREWANVYEDVTEPRPVLLRRKQWEVPKAGKRIGRAEVSEGTLSMRDLSEIKALKKPPVPVRMLMEVCCLLLHIEPVKCFDESARKRLDYWEPARRYLLSDPFLLSKLRSYKDHIEPAQREKIQKLFTIWSALHLPTLDVRWVPGAERRVKMPGLGDLVARDFFTGISPGIRPSRTSFEEAPALPASAVGQIGPAPPPVPDARAAAAARPDVQTPPEPPPPEANEDR
eukprot:g800.t3